jgi:hypothetical protein
MITPSEMLFIASETFPDDICRYFLKMGGAQISCIFCLINWQNYVLSQFMIIIFNLS